MTDKQTLLSGFSITRLALVVVLCNSVAACVPAVVAGGAAAGYYVGQDERTVGEIVDDAAITTSVKTHLIKEPKVSAFDINVDTRNGVVTLFGSVSSKEKENQIIAVAKQVKGVRSVISRITITK